MAVPPPAGWYRPRLGGWAMAAVPGVPAVAFLALVLASAVRRDLGDPSGAVAAGAIAGVLLCSTAVVWPRRYGRARAERGALVVPFSRARAAARLGAWTGFALVAAVGGAGSGDRVVFAVGLAALVVTPPAVMARNPWTAALRVSPRGITLVRGDTTRSAAWDAGLRLVAHDDVTISQGVSFHHPVIRVTQASPKPPAPARRRRTVLDVEADRLAVDPAAVFAILAFYLDHPDARAELGGPRAVERLRVLART